LYILYTKKRLFRWESPASGQEIHPKNGILPGITRSITWKSTGLMEFRWELLASGCGIHRKNGIPLGLLVHGHGFRLGRSEIFQSVTIPGISKIAEFYAGFKNTNLP
jgi:hypothetical protein